MQSIVLKTAVFQTPKLLRAEKLCVRWMSKNSTNEKKSSPRRLLTPIEKFNKRHVSVFDVVTGDKN